MTTTTDTTPLAFPSACAEWANTYTASWEDAARECLTSAACRAGRDGDAQMVAALDEIARNLAMLAKLDRGMTWYRTAIIGEITERDALAHQIEHDQDAPLHRSPAERARLRTERYQCETERDAFREALRLLDIAEQ